VGSATLAEKLSLFSLPQLLCHLCQLCLVHLALLGRCPFNLAPNLFHRFTESVFLACRVTHCALELSLCALFFSNLLFYLLLLLFLAEFDFLHRYSPA